MVLTSRAFSWGVHEKCSAASALGDCKHHQGSIGQILIGHVEDNKYQHDDCLEYEAKSAGRPNLVRELSAPFHAERQ